MNCKLKTITPEMAYREERRQDLATGYAADPTLRPDYRLAMEVLQSALYNSRPAVRDLVDAILRECNPINLA